ncbi:hypothetical protein JCM19298_506 [Nonlabens ulvanivorans]|nr:hypothetical protein JCM19298_506 [Nonlabens ulvanivorans]
MAESNSSQQPLSLEEIQQCIDILNRLNTDTDEIFEIPMERRIELIKQAGLLSSLVVMNIKDVKKTL